MCSARHVVISISNGVPTGEPILPHRQLVIARQRVTTNGLVEIYLVRVNKHGL